MTYTVNIHIMHQLDVSTIDFTMKKY